MLHLVRTPGGLGQAIYLEDEDLVWLTGGTEAIYTTLETTPGAYDTTPNGGGDGGAVRLALPKPATIAEVTPEGGVVTDAADSFTATYTVAAQTFTETVVITHAPRHALSMTPHVTLGDPFVNYAATHCEKGSRPRSAHKPNKAGVYIN